MTARDDAAVGHQWREQLPAACLPREVTKTKEPTVADIDRNRDVIDQAGIPITDLLVIPKAEADTVKIIHPKET